MRRVAGALACLTLWGSLALDRQHSMLRGHRSRQISSGRTTERCQRGSAHTTSTFATRRRTSKRS